MLEEASTGEGSINDEAVSSLIRLAFACEVSKKPAKREDIINMVLGEKHGRLFRFLLAKTNLRLAEDFGMQLVPLPSVARSVSTQTVAGRKAATAAKRQEPSSQGASISAGSYVLQTIMDSRPALRLHRQPDRLALLAIILCLCHLSEDGMIDEGVLYDKLTLLGHEARFGSLADWIATLRKQKYLTISKKSDDANVNYYSAGPRAAIEFPPASLAKFILDLGMATGFSPDHLGPRVNNAFRTIR